ncbi:MAG: diacylglycerol kinase family protein [Wenzhouxiangellaceae bacterium]
MTIQESSAPARAEFGRQTSTGLAALINPLSFRMSLHDRAARSAGRVRAHGGEVFEVTDLAQIEGALEQALGRSIRRLVIAGGDGTLQGVVSYLARHVEPARMPELILLSAGRTNYVAEDIGTASHFLATLERILATPPERLHPVDRPTLKLEHPLIGEQHGFFLAGAMVDEVIRYVHRWQAERDTWLRRRHAASTAGVLSLALRRALGRYRFELPRLAIESDNLGRIDAACRFLLMSTLNHDRSLVDPYARRGDGPVRLTAIARGAKRLPLRLANVARGRFSAGMNTENGYLSGRCSSIMINNLASITLDGQEFDLDARAPLKVSSGPVFRFLRP